jgi:hypothetical protein
LRDSAGFAPDFAVSAPAGDMCPATGAYAITLSASPFAKTRDSPR